MNALQTLGISVILGILPSTINSQLIGAIKFDPNDFSMPTSVDGLQEIFKETIKPGLFIVKTGFQICDKESGDLFGLNGKDEFGESYGIGIKTPNGIVLYDRSVRPWRYNKKFGKYMEKYDPFFTQPMYKSVSTDSQLSSLDLDMATGITLVDSTLYKFDSLTFDKVGFNLNEETGKQLGWMVWITAKGTDNPTDAEKIEYTVFRQEYEIFGRGENLSIDQPDIDQQILGGVFLVPNVPGPGMLQVNLCGIAIPVNENWCLSFPAWDVKKENKNRPIIQADETDKDLLELTPIEKGKEKSKSKKDNKKKKQ